MSSTFADRHKLVLRPFAEAQVSDNDGILDRLFRRARGTVRARLSLDRRKLEARAQLILAAGGAEALSPAEIGQRLAAMRKWSRETDRDRVIDEAMFLAREATCHVLGFRQNLRQVTGALIMVDGGLAEMATGEGKTATALLAAAALALTRRRVHVITVNPYLADRDHAQMAPILSMLSLSSGLIKEDQERPERAQVYTRDVVYCTHKDIMFDYLRDRLALQSTPVRSELLAARFTGRRQEITVLPGLDCALVDEADSVLIDEARTPFILSGPDAGTITEEIGAPVLELAGSLVEGRDFKLSRKDRRVELLEAGDSQLAAIAQHLPSPWSAPVASRHLLTQALSALHLFYRDTHYVVCDDKVQIIDEGTGRLMPDRSWSNGLHQMVELKEGVALTESRRTLTELNFQRLFPRYRLLAGMTGTALEVAGELAETYRLTVCRVPTARPLRRRMLPGTVLPTQDAKWRFIARMIAAAPRDRPILIGTNSVAESEAASAALAEMGLEHTVLNAKQDRDEAEQIAKGGEPGRITVATNMAGRGTDIPLEDDVAERGGLHVILTGLNETRRVDRQLFGRSARKGQNGTAQVIISLEDALFVRFTPFLAAALRRFPVLRNLLGLLVGRLAQRRAEGQATRERRRAVLAGRKSEERLAFADRTA